MSQYVQSYAKGLVLVLAGQLVLCHLVKSLVHNLLQILAFFTGNTLTVRRPDYEYQNYFLVLKSP